MNINYENVLEEADGKQFMSDVHLVLRALFSKSQRADILAANANRTIEKIKADMAAKGYAYNTANMTVSTRGGVQGLIVAVHGEAGDGDTVDDWQDGGMVARFTFDIVDGIVEGFPS